MSKSKPKFLRNIYLEKDKKGNMLFTFTDQELKILGVKPGEMVNFKVIEGKVYISKPTVRPKVKKVTKKANKKNGQ